MTESIQENMEELFSLSAEELQLRLDKLESGSHTFFGWQSDEYPRFVEKVIFQPKRCNVEFPPIGPRAFSRGVRSTSSLPDIRTSDNIELMSNAEVSTRSLIVSVDQKPRRTKTKRAHFGSNGLTVKESPPSVGKTEPLICQGKGFPKSDHFKECGPALKSAVDRVRLENKSSKQETGLPLIQDTPTKPQTTPVGPWFRGKPQTIQVGPWLRGKSQTIQVGHWVRDKPQTTQVGPWFRAWSSQKRERVGDSEQNSKELDFRLDTIEQKAVRSFDLDGLLKEVQRHQNLPSHSMDEIALNSATNYISKIKQELNLSAKGGGFMNRSKHVSVRDEIMIKKKLRQKLFSFYDFGGSGNAFERVVSDVCSKENPSVKFKNLPAYPDNEEKGIFPLAAPHSNLPLLPNSPTQLQKLYNLLDAFPWFTWQPRRPVQMEVVRGSPHSKPETLDDEIETTMWDTEIDTEIKNPKLEVRLPSCVV